MQRTVVLRVGALSKIYWAGRRAWTSSSIKSVMHRRGITRLFSGNFCLCGEDFVSFLKSWAVAAASGGCSSAAVAIHWMVTAHLCRFDTTSPSTWSATTHKTPRVASQLWRRVQSGVCQDARGERHLTCLAGTASSVPLACRRSAIGYRGMEG